MNLRNHKTTIAVVLFLTLVGCVTFRVSSSMLQAAQTQLFDTTASVASSNEELRGKITTQDEVQRGLPDVELFLEEWTPLMIKGSSPSQIGLELSDLAQKAGLVGNRRPTPLRNDYPLGNATVSLQMVGFSIVGDYKAAMTWLGEVEKLFPAARMESLHITGAGSNEVELLINLGFLIQNDSK